MKNLKMGRELYIFLINPAQNSDEQEKLNIRQNKNINKAQNLSYN